MKRYSLSHLEARDVRSGLLASLASERGNTAEVLAHIAEFEDRGLYLSEAYPSMHAYCVGALNLSEDEAYKRIQAARAARKFPAIFDAVAEGRLHLTGVVRLAPHLTPENVGELLAAATHKSKAQIELWLAERFPQSDLPTRVRPLVASKTRVPAPAALNVDETPVAQVAGASTTQLVPEPVPSDRLALSGPMTPPAPPAKVSPRSPGRFALQLTVSQATHDKLRHAQALLGHQIPTGDIAQVIDRALDALIAQLEKRKLAATSRPRATPPPSKPGTRHIPAHVKRAVRQRDGERCAFVSASGLRCQARSRLEFHHVKDFVRGGEATVEGIQLRCRAHNQHEAECTLGGEFMRRKKLAVLEARAAARPHAKAVSAQGTPARSPN